MGAFLWWPLNLLGERWPYLGKEESIRRVIENKQDPLEILLSDALESDRLISVSVKNGKVYIGRLVSSLDPAYGVQSLTLSRSYSGHRDRETSAFHLDTNYEQVLEDAIENLVTEAERRIREETPDLSEDELEERIEDEFEGWERRDEEDEAIRSIVDRLRALEIVIPVAEMQSVNLFDESIYAIVSREEGGDE